jgi:DNA (cytosine-5)-methyltransferase 1
MLARTEGELGGGAGRSRTTQRVAGADIYGDRCAYYLAGVATNGRSQPGATSIDLFCGAGGLTLGLGEAGIRTVLACDNWMPAAETLRRNLEGIPVFDGDLALATADDLLNAAGLAAPPELVAGGPPCQGFSSAGARRNGDHRNSLVARFGELVAELRPRAFVFENVEGFLTAEGGRRVIDLLDPVIDAGYHVHLRKVNAANFGVPQLRKRVLGIGALGQEPPFPEATHAAYGAPGAHLVGARNGATVVPAVLDAIEGLPEPSNGSEAPLDHVPRRLGAVDVARIAALQPGQTMRDLPEHLQHPSYRRRAFRRVMDGTPSARRGGAPAGLRRLVATEPSKAITGAAPRELIHPYEDRPLTLRECARIQTFPDWFEFVGTQSERAVLIGNAVPPHLATVIGHALAQWIGTHEPAAGPGQLVTFSPTASTGMSPALREITVKLSHRYTTSAPLQEALWG